MGEILLEIADLCYMVANVHTIYLEYDRSFFEFISQLVPAEKVFQATELLSEWTQRPSRTQLQYFK